MMKKLIMVLTIVMAGIGFIGCGTQTEEVQNFEKQLVAMETLIKDGEGMNLYDINALIEWYQVTINTDKNLEGYVLPNWFTELPKYAREATPEELEKRANDIAEHNEISDDNWVDEESSNYVEENGIGKESIVEKPEVTKPVFVLEDWVTTTGAKGGNALTNDSLKVGDYDYDVTVFEANGGIEAFRIAVYNGRVAEIEFLNNDAMSETYVMAILNAGADINDSWTGDAVASTMTDETWWLAVEQIADIMTMVGY